MMVSPLSKEQQKRLVFSNELNTNGYRYEIQEEHGKPTVFVRKDIISGVTVKVWSLEEFLKLPMGGPGC